MIWKPQRGYYRSNSRGYAYLPWAGAYTEEEAAGHNRYAQGAAEHLGLEGFDLEAQPFDSRYDGPRGMRFEVALASGVELGDGGEEVLALRARVSELEKARYAAHARALEAIQDAKRFEALLEGERGTCAVLLGDRERVERERDAQRAKVERLKARNARLLQERETLRGQLHGAVGEFHGCRTGDCPHEDVRECDRAIAAELTDQGVEMDRRDTCHVCKGTLLQPEEPPRCEDCHCTEDCDHD